MEDKAAKPLQERLAESHSIPKVLTVSQLTFLIKELLEGTFGILWVEGEISNLSSPFSGHLYFVLKDEGAQIRCVMFRHQSKNLKFLPENGMKVLIRGEIAVYTPRGEYQIIVDHIEPLGIGALALAFEQLKNRLKALGLFDEAKKRPIPYLPQKVAVITSPTGAAIRDFLKVVNRRFGGLHIIVVPVRVQGEEATRDIIEALKLVNERLKVDVIVITRGGGSLEDLWPFNQEALAYAIRDSKIPVVSAVGHEIDWTICDMASDLRAPTPSAAAEMLVREKLQLESKLSDLKGRLLHSLNRQIMFKSKLLDDLTDRIRSYKRQLLLKDQALDDIFERLVMAIANLLRSRRQMLKTYQTTLIIFNPAKILTDQKNRVLNLRSQIINSCRYKISLLKAQLTWKKEHLISLNPLGVLKRGYSITLNKNTNKIITSAIQLQLNDEIVTIYSEGKSISSITKIDK